MLSFTPPRTQTRTILDRLCCFICAVRTKQQSPLCFVVAFPCVRSCSGAAHWSLAEQNGHSTGCPPLQGRSLLGQSRMGQRRQGHKPLFQEEEKKREKQERRRWKHGMENIKKKHRNWPRSIALVGDLSTAFTLFDAFFASPISHLSGSECERCR